MFEDCRHLRIVLLSGPVAVGKSSVATLLLSSFGFEKLSSGRFLLEHASRNQLAHDRRTLQDLGDQLDRATDFRWVLDEVAKPLMLSKPSHRRWLIDAVRKHRQVEHFRECFQNSVFHLHLTAAEGTLRHRYETRARNTDVVLDDYSVVLQHPNEIASRALEAIADLVVDVSTRSAQEIVGIAARRLGIMQS